MPNRTTRDYEGPSVAPKIQAVLDAALEDEGDIDIEDRFVICWYALCQYIYWCCIFLYNESLTCCLFTHSLPGPAVFHNMRILMPSRGIRRLLRNLLLVTENAKLPVFLLRLYLIQGFLGSFLIFTILPTVPRSSQLGDGAWLAVTAEKLAASTKIEIVEVQRIVSLYSLAFCGQNRFVN